MTLLFLFPNIEKDIFELLIVKNLSKETKKKNCFYTKKNEKKIELRDLSLRISFEDRKFADFKFAIRGQNRKLKSRNYLSRKKKWRIL